MIEQDPGAGPALHHDDWSDTCATRHLWHVVGKLRLAVMRWLNRALR